MLVAGLWVLHVPLRVPRRVPPRVPRRVSRRVPCHVPQVVCGTSLLFPQFCCEPKIAPKLNTKLLILKSGSCIFLPTPF